MAYQALFQVDVLVVNVPPRSRSMPGDFYPEQMRYLREMIEQAGIKHVIFASSTSVYPNERQLARETDALLLETSESPGILAAEYHMQGGDFNCTVLRFGGLLGVNRVPGSYFSGKEGVAGNPPVNYIHQEDAIRLIQWVIEEGKWNEVYNAVSPLHPCRREVYEENARRMGFAPPASYAETGAWKTISADKLVEHGFEFVFQDPMKFWYQKV
ncbi:Rossmann-fold NAD(P)-binding domain-containing protein [Nitritalea halalkaliphila]|uniref:epimerase n=1 Tax=Nitritalea halalkaliphila TaxID=590849 RepID=UPI001EE64A83|nr:epimerase [Nitritalea halalkaliphila]